MMSRSRAWDYLRCYWRGMGTMALIVVTGLFISVVAGFLPYGFIFITPILGLTGMSLQRFYRTKWMEFSQPRYLLTIEDIFRVTKAYAYTDRYKMDCRKLVYAIHFVYEEDFIQTKMAI